MVNLKCRAYAKGLVQTYVIKVCFFIFLLKLLPFSTFDKLYKKVLRSFLSITLYSTPLGAYTLSSILLSNWIPIFLEEYFIFVYGLNFKFPGNILMAFCVLLMNIIQFAAEQFKYFFTVQQNSSLLLVK